MFPVWVISVISFPLQSLTKAQIKTHQGKTNDSSRTPSCWRGKAGVQGSNCLTFRYDFLISFFLSLLEHLNCGALSVDTPCRLGSGSPTVHQLWGMWSWECVQAGEDNLKCIKHRLVPALWLAGWDHRKVQDSSVESGCDTGATWLCGAILWMLTQWRRVALTSQKATGEEMESWVALLLLWMIELALVGERAEVRSLRIF